jgi:hypothetical protein
MPKHTPDFSNILSEESLEYAELWICLEEEQEEGQDFFGQIALHFNKKSNWSTQQINIFLETLLKRLSFLLFIFFFKTLIINNQ